MRRRNYKGKCIKKASCKSKDICRTYDDIQLAFLNLLENDNNIMEIHCNVPLDDSEYGQYTTDFVCIKANNEFMVRECVFRKLISKPLTVKLLDISRNYWLKKGITDWGLVANEEK